MAEHQGWRDELYDALKAAGVEIIAYVPDAGHSRAIERAIADPDMEAIVLTTEEEGVALACGAWLGGKKAALLMQSSGVGNCINMLALVNSCRFPFLAVVTMRGEWEEFNPWQKPMGGAAPTVLEAIGVEPREVWDEREVAMMTASVAEAAFGQQKAYALLIAQKLIGKKVW